MVLDITEVIKGVIPMVARLIGEDIKIAVLAHDPAPPVLADRAQIEQVIINLAVNARDAMPTGGTLTLETQTATLDDDSARAYADLAPGRYACLSGTDTGTGIDAAEREHIFEPFYTTKEVGQGTGLGLATVYGIVTQSSCHIVVYSERGLGTTFKIYLPASDAGRTHVPADRHRERRLDGSETILLCEDEDVVRRLIERLLTAAGYTVLATASPLKALELATERRAELDALITDVVMPDMSGPDLAGKVQQLRPGLRTMFLSGYSPEIARERGNLPPGSAFVEKPFDRDTLLGAVRSLLDRPSAAGDGRFARHPNVHGTAPADSP